MINAPSHALKLAPFPQSAPVKRTHEVKGDARQFAEKIGKLFPAAVVQATAGKVTVAASPEEQEQIAFAMDLWISIMQILCGEKIT